MKKIITITCLLGWLLIGYQVYAAGLSVTPDKLSIQTKVKEQASQDIYVKNISPGPVIYNVYSDELVEQIEIQPNFFRLEMGDTQKVKITAQPHEAGIYLTNISVVASDLDQREFNASTGVKVPLQIIVLSAAGFSFPIINLWVIIIAVVAVATLLLILAVNKRKKRSLWQKIGHSVNLLHHRKPWWKRWFN